EPLERFRVLLFSKQAQSSISANTPEMADGARFELAEDISAFPRLAGEYLKPLSHPSNEPFDKSGWRLGESNPCFRSARPMCSRYHQVPMTCSRAAPENGSAGKNRTSNTGAYETPQPTKACPRQTNKDVASEGAISRPRHTGCIRFVADWCSEREERQ